MIIIMISQVKWLGLSPFPKSIQKSLFHLLLYNIEKRVDQTISCIYSDVEYNVLRPSPHLLYIKFKYGASHKQLDTAKW